MFMSKSNLIA